MSEQPDQQVAQAADTALQEIARMHEYALEAVRHHYPAPAPSARHAATTETLAASGSSHSAR